VGFFDGQNKPLNNNEFLQDCNTYPTELSALDIKFHEKGKYRVLSNATFPPTNYLANPSFLKLGHQVSKIFKTS
jgi:hypothetical protein